MSESCRVLRLCVVLLAAASSLRADGSGKQLEVAAPSTLSAAAAGNSQRAELSWTDNVEGEEGFVVERSSDGGNHFDPIGRARADATSYVDLTAPAGQSMTYRVYAVGAGWQARTSPVASVTTSPFQTFDTMLFEGKPPASRLGMAGMLIGYEGYLIAARDRDNPNEAMTRTVARRAATLRQPLVLDIEHWPHNIREHSKEEVEATITKFIRQIGWVRDEWRRRGRTELQVGIYGLIPVPFAPHGEDLHDPKDLAAWKRANDFLRGMDGTTYRREFDLSHSVDFLCPSLYTVSQDVGTWAMDAELAIEEARRFGKPVYPFVWMMYHEFTPDVAHHLLPSSFWRFQLDTTRRLADGVVVWGGHQRRWQGLGSWWEETRRFLAAGPVPAPQPPADLQIDPVGMHLTWADRSDNESGFRVERSSDGKRYHLVSATLADQIAWTDPAIRSGATYHYRVQASHAYGTSGWTNATSPPAARDARTRIEAETFDETGNVSGSGGVRFGYAKRSIGHLDNGDWIKYGDVHFGKGVKRVTIRLAVPKETAGQQIEFWIGGPSPESKGSQVGTLTTLATRGWTDFTNQMAAVDVRGAHDLYLVFRGKPAYGVAEINWIRFDAIVPAEAKPER